MSQGPGKGQAPRRTLRFVLCADDFALSEGVSAAILDLLGSARLSATSVMANRPNWEAAAPRLREFAGKADLGLHLNLTCGAPLGVMSRFAPSGALPPLPRVLRTALSGGLPFAEIADEFRRQIDAFAHHMGREPDFLDGHQHVHALPGVRVALLEAIDGLGLAGRLYVRDPVDRPLAIAARGLSAGKALLVAVLARGFGTALAERGIAANEGFAGFAPFDARRDYAADFERFLRAPGRRHLVMCHPGFADAGAEGIDRADATRPLEHDFLAGPGFTALMTRLNAMPVRFADIR